MIRECLTHTRTSVLECVSDYLSVRVFEHVRAFQSAVIACGWVVSAFVRMPSVRVCAREPECVRDYVWHE